jgi:branched-chain amino acid transport system substrate-binding protein
MKRFFCALALVLAICCLSGHALVAEDGVTGTTVVIGNEKETGGFSGDEENLGFTLAVREANDRGGVRGRTLQILGYVRKGGATEGVANAKRLVEVDKVFCLFNFSSMPLAMALAPYVMEKKVPYLFPHQGSATLDKKRYIFTSYPYYEDECEIMLQYLAKKRGFKKIAILYADNAYGRIFRDKLREYAGRVGYETAGEQAIKEMKPADLTNEMKALQKDAPNALIMALYPEQAKKALEAKGALAWKDVTMVSTGPLTDEDYLNVEGGHGEGTIGLCLYPDPSVNAEPGIVEYRKVMAKYHPGKQVNRYSLYGYVFGKLVIEGLQRAGKDLTREKFIEAMESIKNWDSGGILPPVSFSATNHHAQTAGFIAELKNGKFVPLTDWVETSTTQK